MTTARLHLKLQGLCLLTKISFVLGFLDIISVHCIFSGGKGVVSVFGAGYVCGGFYACFMFKCRGTVSLWVITMSTMNVFDCLSPACALPLLFTS